MKLQTREERQMTATATAAVAQHLNVVESAIIKIEEWNNVLFVVVKSLGARFVSKKITEKKVTVKKLIDTKTGTVSYGIITAKGGCYNTYKTERAAKNALAKMSEWYVEYHANSALGSYMMSIASGRYQVVNL